MRLLMTLFLVSSLNACAKKAPVGSGSSAASGDAGSAIARAGSAASSAATADAAVPSSPTKSAVADEVAQLVVNDVGSPAFGKQTIEASCVSVVILPAGTWTIAAAHLNGCGDKTARSILWVYRRADNGTWNEDYVGQPPKCWKGVPADIAEAVSKATKIPNC